MFICHSSGGCKDVKCVVCCKSLKVLRFQFRLSWKRFILLVIEDDDITQNQWPLLAHEEVQFKIIVWMHHKTIKISICGVKILYRGFKSLVSLTILTKKLHWAIKSKKTTRIGENGTIETCLWCVVGNHRSLLTPGANDALHI